MRRLCLTAALLALLPASAALAADPPPAPPPPPPPAEGAAPVQTPPVETPPPVATPPVTATPSAGPPEPASASWAKKEIAAVVAAGLLSSTVGDFRPLDRLTKGELSEALVALGGSPLAGNPTLRVKLRELDAALVRLLGLSSAARQVRDTLAGAGLAPRVYTGNEVVARLLGLRLNHPQSDESLELLPNDAVTRAEAAYSLARVLDLRAGDVPAAIAGQVASLALPQLTDWQRQVLARAVRFVGYPYIWGGSSERAQAPFGRPAPGGFDCSGFVWRVYKLQPFPGADSLATTLKGRTTYVMSGEVGPERRISLEALQPADVLFFGDRGPKSKPAQIGHMGIYLGGGWMVHSSSRGTTIAPLDGWYVASFAWARRPLAEAGLA